MTKKHVAGDALACATRCDDAGIECGEGLPKFRAQFQEAAQIIRTLHAALSRVDCQHMIVFEVKKEMVDRGLDTRAPGKYCMLCGEPIVKPAKTKDNDAGTEESQP